jgi:hypothetical protein
MARPAGPLLAATTALAISSALSSCGGGGPQARPTPIPTIAPSPTPTPVASSCALGMGSIETSCGVEDAAQLGSYIEAALDMLEQEKPQLLDLTTESYPNSGLYRVVDTEGYLDTIVDNLRRQLVCAERDGDSIGLRRIVVKDTNAFSEVFDVLSDNNFMRRGAAAYRQTCSPASFPIDRSNPDVPPAGSGCGRPYPPPISRFNCKVHLAAPEYYTGDATPIIGPNIDYCSQVGFTDGRSLCPVRAEGYEDRIPCENWRVGRASDTGRYGPTWTRLDGAACTGVTSNCENDPDNQYQIRVFTSGTVKARATNGADCTLQVDR